MFNTLQQNFCSPLTLAFGLGIVAKLIRSDLALPRDAYSTLSIYLLLALGLKGGVELSHAALSEVWAPALATLALGVITPLTSYAVLRKFGRFDAADAAGIAAHYGSVSAVTFIAAQQFALSQGMPAEGYMSTLLTLLESPGIHIALLIGALQSSRDRLAVDAPAPRPTAEVVHEILASRSMVLLVGGLVIGYLTGPTGYEPVKPFFEGLFKGVLTIFLLEMGVMAAARLGDLRAVGVFLIGFGILMPIFHGALAVMLGHAVGMSVGGSAVLGAMAASASYIAAPPAVRMTLPQANPTYYLTASLAITFPFNLLAGIPLYFAFARWLGSGG